MRVRGLFNISAGCILCGVHPTELLTNNLNKREVYHEYSTN